jgi:hypothetical protein
LLPLPPDDLAGAPRAFYTRVRETVAAAEPLAIDWDAVEVDFGDAGVAVSLPHARESDWLLTAQCSRVAAVVFAGPTATHFDHRDEGWTDAAVAFLGAVLRGERELELPHRRREPVETVRISFRA